jgi:serine/threonine protein phosphatase PrpC
VVCVVQNGSAYWAHAGDSRLYVLRGGSLVAATSDHSRVQQMIESGVLTPEAAARHPDRNKIFSCLGGVVPPQIAIGREWPLKLGDTIVLSTDGFWAQIQPAIMGTMLKKQTIIELFPGLLTEAHRRAAGESDNLSVVAMTWEAQDDPNAADTTQLEMEQFATATNTEALDPGKPADDVTEEDIERAIAEIQDAIKKVPR